MNKNKKLQKKFVKNQHFWALVDDEQAFLYTTKEKYGGKKKEAKSSTQKYKTDSYVGIEYDKQLTVPDYGQPLIDTTGFTVTVLPSQF
jgi:hypothetical protein